MSADVKMSPSSTPTPSWHLLRIKSRSNCPPPGS